MHQKTSPEKSVRIFILVLTKLKCRLHKHCKCKLAEAERHALVRAEAWQRSDPHESLFRSESCLHLGMQIHSQLPPQHSSLHLLTDFLHLSLPLIKTLNWLIHTCSCTGSFGTSLHHPSRFSHQLWVHSGAHCPSFTYRAKQWSGTAWVCMNASVLKAHQFVRAHINI